MDKTEKIVLGILKKLVSRDRRKKLHLGSNLREDLGLNSIKLVQLVAALESKTGFDIADVGDDVDLAEILTVREVVETVKKQLNPAG